jgi:hypothetical protein
LHKELKKEKKNFVFKKQSQSILDFIGFLSYWWIRILRWLKYVGWGWSVEGGRSRWRRFILTLE